MFELWKDSPFEIFRLAKYLLAPAGAILFLGLVPLLWVVPQRAFRPILLAGSFGLLVLSWGPTFVTLLGVFLLAVYPFVRQRRWISTLGCWVLLEAAYALLFHLPFANLPVFADQRFAQIFPSMLQSRAVVFGSGLAFTNLRLLHLLLEARREEQRMPLSLSNYFLYLLYAPTYRFGPYVAFKYFNSQVDTARKRITQSEVARGFGEVLWGALIFEAVIKLIDDHFFRPYYPDDGSYLYLQFFERPPASPWLTLGGVLLVMTRLYLMISAYSHIVAGMSRMVGIVLPQNMIYPVAAANPADFWRRYHVTVSNHVRCHVLVPIADRLRRTAPAFLAAFAFIGFWHQPSWNCLLWAGLQAGAVVAWMLARRVRPKVVGGPFVPVGISSRLRRMMGTIFTLTFIMLTTPVLLDSEYGGGRIFRQLIGGDWGSLERNTAVQAAPSNSQLSAEECSPVNDVVPSLR